MRRKPGCGCANGACGAKHRDLLMLLQEAQADAQWTDIDTLEQSSQAIGGALLRLQQILSPRTINRQTTAEPWNRS